MESLVLLLERHLEYKRRGIIVMITIKAIQNTVIKRLASDSTSIDDPDDKFDLKNGDSLDANWIRSVGAHWEFELISKKNGFFNWFAYKQHVSVDGVPIDPPPAAAGISSQVKAFLDMISVHEAGTSGPNGYRVCFTGVLCVSPTFSDHPRHLHTGGGLTSDAAGRYQFLSTTWDSVANSLGLTDFSPGNQDLAAVELIRWRRVLKFVEAGDVRTACEGVGGTTGVAYEWASLPPGRYGQPVISFNEAEKLFVSFGGVLAP
jgi:muramidase (phage lysozyme)